MRTKMILVSRILAALGILLALYSLVGRFVGPPAILGFLVSAPAPGSWARTRCC